ncbi:MAG: type II toxin-antitoxin system YafQ family toxin [Defluviitaleaceae bacterium]|nr:type II toxin-antitoxin system YafQ family toxin [Defluviitaleaceae bacterium]MCL2240378.1 type II toxin-antitoxin system YafQ family toxin [Defluviitaleaceae bacterium]
MSKRKIKESALYKRDYKKAKKQGKNIILLREVITLLANDIPLPDKHRDHALTGNWQGHRECHITPDWLLVYRKTDTGGLLLVLVRAASHSELDF